MLNMIKPKTKPRTELPADYRSALKTSSVDHLIANLKTMRKSVHEQILSLEAEGMKATEGLRGDIEIRALALLGDGGLDLKPTKPVENLYEKRQVIDRALQLADARRTDEVSRRFAAEILRRRGEYDALITEIALAILALRRAIKSRDEFLEPLRGAIGSGTLPCSKPLPQVTVVGNDIPKFLAEAVRAGILTPKELEL